MKTNICNNKHNRIISMALVLMILFSSFQLVLHSEENYNIALEDKSNDKYADDEVLILLKNCEENKKAEFHLAYSDDKNYFKTHEKTLQHDVVPTSEFVDALSVDIDIKEAKLLNPSVLNEKESTYRLEDKHNSIFYIKLGETDIGDALAILNDNPLIEIAEPNYTCECLAVPNDPLYPSTVYQGNL